MILKMAKDYPLKGNKTSDEIETEDLDINAYITEKIYEINPFCKVQFFDADDQWSTTMKVIILIKGEVCEISSKISMIDVLRVSDREEYLNYVIERVISEINNSINTESE